jgi:hypothetical protein
MREEGIGRSPENGILFFSIIAIFSGVLGLFLPRLISPELEGFEALAAALEVWLWTMVAMVVVSVPLAAFTWARRKEIRRSYLFFGCLPAGIILLVILGLTGAVVLLRS